MSTAVNVFNTSYSPVQISVNNGAPFMVPAANPPNWNPSSVTQGGPSWSFSPAPNVLAPGANRIVISVPGEPPQQLHIDLPNVQWSSVQLYFSVTYNGLAWMVLNSGQYVAGGLPG